MKQILLFVDVHNHNEDGEVDEVDMVMALKEVISALRDSAEHRDKDAEMMISAGIQVGPNEDVHAKVLVGSAETLSIVYQQLEMMAGVGSMAEHDVSEIREALNKASHGTAVFMDRDKKEKKDKDQDQ